MKNKLLIALLFLFTGFFGTAQTPTFVGQTSASAIGSGPGGKPTLSWNIPPGKDRVMIITLATERYHDPFGGNFPSTPATAGNGIYVNGNFATYLNGRIYRDPETYSDTRYSFHHSLFYLSDANGDLPTGDVDFTMPDLNTPLSAGDEMIITATLYKGVKNIVDFAYDGIQKPTGTTVASASNPHLTVVGNGVTAANILYVGFGASSQSSQLAFAPNTWSSPTSIILNNNAGPAPSGSVGEPNGISVQVGNRTFAANLTPTLTVTKASNSNSMRGVANMIALMPFAHPSVSGTVYNDTNGPSSIGGTGTNAGGLYVNAIDDDNKLIFSATVAANGTFTIPTGYVIEGNTYRFELSKNTGTIGNNAPIKELPSGYTTVGESTSATGNDGTHDGIITLLNIGVNNISGLRFGINTCNSGTAAPIFNTSALLTYNNVSTKYSYRIPCSSFTANLSTVTASNKPAPSAVVITWHSSATATDANKIANVTAIVGTRKIYAAFYDTVNLCYSATQELTVQAPICASPDDYTATPVTYGTTMTLTPSIFANDSYNGASFTGPHPSILFKGELWTTEVVVNPNGTLTVTPSPTFGVGTHTLSYSICDKSPDSITSTACSNDVNVIIKIVAPCNAGTVQVPLNGTVISN